MISKNNFILTIITLVWTAVVFGAYWLFHYNPAIVSVGLVLYVVGIIFLFLIKKTNIVYTRQLPVWLLVLCGLMGVWGFAVVVTILFGVDVLSARSLFFSMIYVALYSVFTYFFIVMLIGFGKKLFSIVGTHKNTSLPLPVYAGVGIVACIYIAMILGLLQLFQSYIALSTIALIVIFARKEIYSITKSFFSKKIVYTFSTHSIQTIITSLLPFFIFLLGAALAVLGFRATTFVADDAAVYYRVPLMLAEYGGTVPFFDGATAARFGGFAYLSALLHTALPQFLLMFFSPIFLFLTIWTLYDIGEKLRNTKTALFISIAAMITPWHTYFVFTSKVIFLFSFLSLVAVLLLMYFLQHKKNIFLYSAAFFVGAAILIKLNGIFLAIVFATLLCVFFLTKKISFRQFFISTCCMVIAYIPQAGMNVYLYNDPLVTTPYVYESRDDIFSQNKDVYLLDIVRYSALKKERAAEYVHLLRQKKPFDTHVANIPWTLWNSTVHQRGHNMSYVDIGFVGLTLLPLVLFVFLKKRKQLTVSEKTIIGITALGGLLWYVFGKESTWYGIVFWYVYWVLCGALFFYMSQKQRFVVQAILSLQAVIFFVVALGSINPAQTHWLLGVVDQQTIEQQSVWHDTATAINAEISAGSADRVLMVPEQKALYIKENNTRVIADSLGHYWAQLVYEADGDPVRITEFLHQQRITHIMVSQSSENWLRSYVPQEKQGSYALYQYFDILHTYTAEYAEKVYCNSSACVYKIL